MQFWLWRAAAFVSSPIHLYFLHFLHFIAVVRIKYQICLCLLLLRLIKFVNACVIKTNFEHCDVGHLQLNHVSILRVNLINDPMRNYFSEERLEISARFVTLSSTAYYCESFSGWPMDPFNGLCLWGWLSPVPFWNGMERNTSVNGNGIGLLACLPIYRTVSSCPIIIVNRLQLTAHSSRLFCMVAVSSHWLLTPPTWVGQCVSIVCSRYTAL